MDKKTITVIAIISISIVIGFFLVFVYEFPITDPSITDLCGKSEITIYDEWRCYVNTPREKP